jgi:uncharacterized membrane protein YccC
MPWLAGSWNASAPVRVSNRRRRPPPGAPGGSAPSATQYTADPDASAWSCATKCVGQAGFDDVPLASQVWPALTTIRQPISAMSAKAADLLLQQLRGEPEDRAAHVLESSVTFRQSTGPAHNQKLQQMRSSRRAKAAVATSASDE